jgi:predicted ATPase/DNA-binding XRE family transcriptional regulator
LSNLTFLVNKTANWCILLKIQKLYNLMAGKGKSASPLVFDTFGDLLKYLRKRAQLTQRELAIAVGYSEAHITRLEKHQRLPDLSTLAALFVPALSLEDEPDTIARLLELAAVARGENLPSSGNLIVRHSIKREVIETFEAGEIPTNLPLQLTSFIGREPEIEEIESLIRGEERHKLITLVGAGGCGKTRLALQVAGRIVHLYPDGVWFIDLAPLADPNLVPRTTASTLSISETQEEPITKTLVRFLQSKKILLLFDNCEHILESVAELAEALLRTCPHIQILATTREVLNVPGEKSFHVLPLPYPPEGKEDKNRIAEFDSVRLFIQRAKNVQTSFDLTDENASFIAQVCRRLDGIPLAIELAAARVGLLRVQQIESQLKDRFKLLTGGGRTLPRHQTLRAMVDWSHALLSKDECRLFRRLSVFAGGWILESADAVQHPSSQTSTLDLLSRLIDKSFILVERQLGKEARYSMLETLRDYAFEKLGAAEEIRFAREQHFQFFHNLALRSRLYGSEKQIWLDRLEADYDNIRAAVTWALAYHDAEGMQPYIEETTELILALTDFFWFRGFTAEAREWMDQLLGVEMPASPLRALLLQKSGWYARVSGDFKKADLVLHRALDMAKEITDWNRAAWALMDLGLSTRDQGDNSQSIQYFTEGLRFAKQSGEDRAVGACLYSLAESYELIGDLNTASDLWKQGLSLFRVEGDKTHIAWGLEGLAGTAYLAKDLASALKLHLESLRIKVEVMDRLGIAYSLEGLAQVAAAEEEPERAAILWGAANHLRETMNIPLDPSREELYTSLIPRIREQIGDVAFEEAWKKGESMKLEEGIDFGLHTQSR